MFFPAATRRLTVLALTTYMMVAGMLVAVGVSAWQYAHTNAALKEKNRDLEHTIASLTEYNERTWSRHFVSELMRQVPVDREGNLEEPHRDAFTRAVVDANNAVGLKLPHIELRVCLRNAHPAWAVSNDNTVDRLCTDIDSYPFRADVQDGVFTSFERLEDGTKAFLLGKPSDKRSPVNDWIVGIVQVFGPDFGVVSPDRLARASSQLSPSAWGHIAMIFVSVGVGCFVVASSRRLRQTARQLMSMPDDLDAIMVSVHDARSNLSAIHWTDLEHRLTPDLRPRLKVIQEAVDRVNEKLGIPLDGASRRLGAARWQRKMLTVWDGHREFTDLKELLDRIKEQKRRVAQVAVDVETSDVIEQQISEYDAERMLNNMIDNAIEHGSPPITVTLTRRVRYPHQEGPTAEIVVNNGGSPYGARKYNAGSENDGERKIHGHGEPDIKSTARKYHGDYEIGPGPGGCGAQARLTLDI